MPQRGVTKYRVPNPQPNDISVSLWLSIGSENLLLGADLEEHNDPKRGWTAIIASHDRPTGVAGYYKIVHHGSVTTHHEGIWTKLLGASPIAVLTPWNREKRLPSPADRDRLIKLTPNGFATARANPSTVRQLQAVERVLRESGIKINAAEPVTGFVRARKSKTQGGTWQVDRSQNAVRLKDCA
jgi:hypothetical protein